MLYNPGILGAFMLAIEKYIPQLSAMYSEPHRAYHSLTHIHGLNRLIINQSWVPLVQNGADWLKEPSITKELTFIAWFHDCYYDPYLGSPKNEQISADIFKAMVLPDARDATDNTFIEQVYDGIILTSKHLQQLKVDSHSFTHLVFMDLDMLGFADKNELLVNNPAVRKEYYKTSDIEYLTNRLKFLKALLAKERIYYTLSDNIEANARENIAASIKQDSNLLDILVR